jgi:hypothetical protein
MSLLENTTTLKSRRTNCFAAARYTNVTWRALFIHQVKIVMVVSDFMVSPGRKQQVKWKKKKNNSCWLSFTDYKNANSYAHDYFVHRWNFTISENHSIHHSVTRLAHGGFTATPRHASPFHVDGENDSGWSFLKATFIIAITGFFSMFIFVITIGLLLLFFLSVDAAYDTDNA